MKWAFQVSHLQFSYHEAYASLWQISCQNWKATLEKMNELSLWKWAHYHVYYQFSPHSYISVRWNGTVQTDFSPLSPSAFLNLPRKNSVSLGFTHAELQMADTCHLSRVPFSARRQRSPRVLIESKRAHHGGVKVSVVRVFRVNIVYSQLPCSKRKIVSEASSGLQWGSHLLIKGSQVKAAGGFIDRSPGP